jgi:hypothetical protein
MPFKRKARILFLDGGSGMAARAAALVGEMADAWLEGKGASLPVDGWLLDWADLVVTLDGEAERRCPPLPRHGQRRHYPAADEAALRERIAGMVGGLKLLARAGG